MLQDLEFDDSDSPAIGLVPPGVSWDEVRDHIKIAHHCLLVPPADGGEYAGAYWTGTDMVVIPDLGTDQDQAVEEFRAFLQEHETELAPLRGRVDVDLEPAPGLIFPASASAARSRPTVTWTMPAGSTRPSA